MLEFILARYNYWIVIILMLTGLYIVFSRGNLVKTVIGLNVFQTSVFIFYITLGKVVGGNAPILPYPDPNKSHGDGHGGYGSDHAEDVGHGAASAAHAEEAQDPHPAAETHVSPEISHNDAALSPEDALAVISGESANILGTNEPGSISTTSEVPYESLHDLGEADFANSLYGESTDAPEPHGSDDIVITHADESHAEVVAQGAHEADHAAGDVAHQLTEIVYSNPLPHVLILTAIVVGVATTAVGLALAVRIREAYGTIEEDALEAMDNEAATGSPRGEGGQA